MSRRHLSDGSASMRAMLIPVLIFILALSAGAIASAQWLPDLAAGSVGGLAFFAVCSLVGTAAGLLGLHIYSIVEELNNVSAVSQGEIVAGGLRNIAFDVGSLLGFASVIYLLAPAPELDIELDAEPAT
jgi:hypothetical protein